MSTNLEKLKTEIMALPIEERASLAKSLIESLDETEDSSIDQLWLNEIDRRYSEVKSEKLTLRKVEDVISEAKERLKARQ